MVHVHSRAQLQFTFLSAAELVCQLLQPSLPAVPAQAAGLGAVPAPAASASQHALQPSSPSVLARCASPQPAYIHLLSCLLGVSIPVRSRLFQHLRTG